MSAKHLIFIFRSFRAISRLGKTSRDVNSAPITSLASFQGPFNDKIKLVGHEIFSLGIYGLMASYLWVLKNFQEPFQDLEKQVQMSNSAPITTPASLQGPFNGIDNKEKIRDVKIDVDSSSSSHGRREVELDTRNNEGAIVKLQKDILVLPMMGFSITVFFSLMTFHNPTDMNLGMRIFMPLLPISFLTYFIGFSLPNKYSKKSDLIKLVGHEIFSLGIYGLMASYLWYYNMAFIPILCAILTTVLLVMAYLEKL
ncbi:hypothetical protein FNV43_RR26754 [Rhamnella rubrinervis]|uniref:Uncharacterized protein n=1 Tax=Rhamnella rubrinervis TaxID=2594499 RepID=A0A8K0DQG8_9ROSA|nr:hypothetical protein FNV43_RR26754 [Rhamnella rubrinervis]